MEICHRITGDFKLEFHLGCDYKCLKALYNDGSEGCVQDGPCAKECCLFGHCKLHEFGLNKRGKDRTNSETKGSVLGLPLKRVHLCVLHGEMRLVEKLLHNHLQYVWTCTGRYNSQRETRMSNIMRVLNADVGLHSYEMSEDPKRKGFVRKAALAGMDNIVCSDSERVCTFNSHANMNCTCVWGMLLTPGMWIKPCTYMSYVPTLHYHPSVS